MPNIESGKMIRKGSDSGFTLLEVLVALTMIAIVFVSVIKLQGQSITMNETARFYAMAPFLAQAKMAEVRHDPSSFTGVGSGDFGEDYPGYQVEIDIEEHEIKGDQGNIEGRSVMMLAAVVTVSHKSAGMKFRLSEYIHDVSGDQF